MRDECKYFLQRNNMALCQRGGSRIISQKWCDTCEKHTVKETNTGDEIDEMAGKQRIKWDIQAKELFPYADANITLRDHVKKLYDAGDTLAGLSKKLGVAPNTVGAAIGVYKPPSKAKPHSSAPRSQDVQKRTPVAAIKADLRHEKEEACHEFLETNCGDYPEAKMPVPEVNPVPDMFTAFLSATNQHDIYKGFVLGYELRNVEGK